MARYIRIEKSVLNPNLSSQLYLNIAEVEVIDSKGINIALNKKATQLSTAPENAFHTQNTCRDASCAVDGDTNGDWFSIGKKVSTNSITHTYLKPKLNSNSWDLLDRQDTIWWEVDLGGGYDVRKINVYNRIDAAGDRMKYSRVIVLDVNKNVMHSYLLEDERELYTITV